MKFAVKFLALFVFASASLFAQNDSLITFSEIMFKPNASNSEFIELYNTSATESIDLSGFKIKYYTSSPDGIIDAGNGTVLQPESYAVIFEGDYDFATGIYNGLIDPNALVLIIDNNAFGSSGMSNSSDRIVRLFNAADDSLDARTYTANNGSGVSDEKIIMNKDNSDGNWANSLTDNGTPGYANSVTPLQFDLSVSSLALSPEPLYEGDDLTIETTVKNVGTSDATNFTIEIYDDANADSVGQAGELIFTNNYANLASGDSVTANAAIASVPLGDVQIISQVVFNDDQNPANDKRVEQTVALPQPNQFNDIVINEIMYAPDGGEPEWVELFNRTGEEINLHNWKFSDSGTQITITNENIYIPANGYVVLADDISINDFYDITAQVIVANLPSLNNGGDDLSVIDSLGSVIDNVAYQPDWGGSGGASLERIDADAASNDQTNWGTSVNPNGATPGDINSLSPKDFDVAVASITNAPEIPVEGDNVLISAKIKNLGLQNAANFLVEIFNDANFNGIGETNELIFSQTLSIASGDSANAQTTINNAALGAYQIIAEATFADDEDNSNNSMLHNFNVIPQPNDFNDIVINEIMYSPENDEPEWVELFNRTNEAINLRHWRIHDAVSSVNITDDNVFIPARGYAVIADDATISNYYSQIPATIITANLPSLNNSGDDVILRDSLARTIDSLKYSSTWGGKNGRSLERKLFDEPTNDENNWGSSIHPEGATPGSENSITPKNNDAALNALSVFPESPFQGESAQITAEVFNAGLNDAAQFKIDFYEDSNDDGLPQPEEFFASKQIASLPFGDTTTVSASRSFTEGSRTVFAVVNYQSDENPYNDTLSVSFEVGPERYNYNDVVINEVMYKPSSGEPEWIEIYNRSSKSVNLKNWRIADNSTRRIISDVDLTMAPRTFVVLSKDISINDFYDVPSRVIVLSLPSLGNSGDEIFLTDPSDFEIDNLDYSPDWGGNEGGRSLERKDVNENTNLKSNWATSTDEAKATPGKKNSVIPKDYDLALTEFVIQPDAPSVGDTLRFSALIENVGKRSASSFSFIIYEDANGDSTGDQTEIIFEKSFQSLASGAKTTADFETLDIQSGTRVYIAEVLYSRDEITENNILFESVYVNPPPANFSDIVINEIMYKPASGEPEWIEIFNRSGDAINLNGWRFGDRSRKVTLTDEDAELAAGAFAVISSDETLLDFFDIPSLFIVADLPSLNNTGDDLTLYDPTESKIDSVFYRPSWGGNETGVSLERLSVDGAGNDSTNWSSSVSLDGGTPGTVNSVTQKNFDLAIINFTGPENAVKDSTVYFDVTIQNLGGDNADDAELNVYNDENQNGEPEENELFFNYALNSLQPNGAENVSFSFTPAQSGIVHFIAVVDFPADEALYNNAADFYLSVVSINEQPNDLVINEIMYAPGSDEPEWFEIYNRSAKTINLKNYQIADSKDTTSRVIKEDVFIEPEEYFIFAKDSTIFDKYDIPSAAAIVSFPSLNNGGDAVAILDSLNRTIDSVKYSSDWGGTGGKSLERLSPEVDSNFPSNWRSSVDSLGATPGRKNSNSLKDFDIQIADVIISNDNGVRRVSAIVKNVGKNDAQFDLTLYEDATLDGTADKTLETKTGQFIAAGSQTEIEFDYAFENLLAETAVIVDAVYPNDMNPDDNVFYADVRIPYSARALLINEVMFRPSGGEPEWIEFYNNTSQIINLKDWTIGDVLTTPSSEDISENNLVVQPHSLFVISKDSTIQDFHAQIPSGFAVSEFPNLNNDADGVVIKDWDGNLIDSLFYDGEWNSKSGYSIEKISETALSNNSDNWKASIDVEQSTPGRTNSVVIKNNDLAALTVSSVPAFPQEGEMIKLKCAVANVGLNDADNFSVAFSYLSGSNSILLEEISGLNLSQGDTLEIITNEDFQLSGAVEIQAEVIYDADEDLSNNSVSAAVQPGYEANSILVSEVMYNPASGFPEWVEFKNVSEKEINLNGWSVSDVSPSLNLKIITEENELISPNKYFVVAKDSNVFGIDENAKLFVVNFGALGNTGDGVVIYDFRGAAIDSLYYFPEWGNKKGVSLERFSYDVSTNDDWNWLLSISPNGSTPGYKNSVSGLPQYENGDVVINEIMFDPLTDNSEFVEIYNRSDKYVELGGWTLEDGSGKLFAVSDVTFSLPPNEFFTIASDSSVYDTYEWLGNADNINVLNAGLGLSNNGEPLTLLDIYGNAIDSVYYSDKWNNPNISFTKGKSLERLNPRLGSNDPSNWSTSVSDIGATPDKVNSIFIENPSTSAKISVSPNPFSPDDDGFEDFAIINYNLTQAIAQIRVKVYDSKGRKVRTLESNKASASTGSLIFNGLDDNGRPLRIGIYILFIEAINGSNGVVETIKGNDKRARCDCKKIVALYEFYKSGERALRRLAALERNAQMQFRLRVLFFSR
ncbi:MAG: hypothetical protein GXO87_14975 [Chlorobi bacterium]|nr:hypothetical protein [Chlorobiota bacterium]